MTREDAARPVFLPWQQACGQAHAMVDSQPVAGTVLALSHWPGVRNPIGLRSDTSTGIVLDYLAEAGGWPDLRWVSAGHLDVDALLALHVVLCPEQRPLAPFWRALARAGDFRVAARPATRHALLALEAELGRVAQAQGPSGDAAAGRDFFTLLAWLKTHGEALARGVWPPQLDSAVERAEAHARHSARVLARGTAIRRWPKTDLASLSLAADAGPGIGLADRPYLGLDEFALHARCDALQVLVSQAGVHRLDQRYESWVQGPDPAWACRRDLRPLCRELSALDPDAGWHYDGVHDPFASLRTGPGRRSRLAHDWLAWRCAEHMRSHPPAWRPHAGAGCQPAAMSAPSVPSGWATPSAPLLQESTP